MVRPDERVVLHYRPARRLLGGYRPHLIAREPEPEPLPPRRRWVPWTLVLPLGAAVALGTGAGYASTVAALAVVAVAGVAVMALHPQWAVLVVVGSAVFEDYLAQVHPATVKVLAGLLVVAWAIRRSRGPLHRSPRSPVLSAAMAFAIALLVSTAVHNNGAAGLQVVLRYAGFLVVLLVVADVVRAGLPAVRVARVYVATCAVAAACGLAGFAVVADRRVGGPVGDPNDFAFFLLPAVALALAVRSSGRRTWPWDLAAVLMVVALLGTLSRGAVLGLALVGLFAVLAGMARPRVVVALGTVVTAAVLVVLALAPGLVSTSLEQKSAVADQNVSERLAMWSAAARMTVEHPVLGLGPGAFAVHHEDYVVGRPVDVNHRLDVAHNTWLELSSELGLVGLAAFAALLVVAFVAAWRVWRDRRDPLAAGVAVSLVGTAVAATFVSEQYYLPMWLLCALAAGLTVEVTHSTSAAREVEP